MSCRNFLDDFLDFFERGHRWSILFDTFPFSLYDDRKGSLTKWEEFSLFSGAWIDFSSSPVLHFRHCRKTPTTILIFPCNRDQMQAQF